MKNISQMDSAFQILIGAEATLYAEDAAIYVQDFWRKQNVPVPSVETMIECQNKNKYTLTIVQDQKLQTQCVVETYAIRHPEITHMLTGDISESEMPTDAFNSYSPQLCDWTLYSAILCDEDKSPSKYLSAVYSFAGVVGAAKTIEVAYLSPHRGRSVNIKCYAIDASLDGEKILNALQFGIDRDLSARRAANDLHEQVWLRSITSSDIESFWFSLRNSQQYKRFADTNSFIFRIG